VTPRKPPTPAIRQKANLSESQMRAAIPRLKARVTDLEGLDLKTISRGNDPAIEQLEAAIENTISAIFGPDSHEYDKLKPAWDLDTTGYYAVLSFGGRTSGGPSQADIQAGVDRGRKRAIALLQQAATSLEEELKYLAPEAIKGAPQPAEKANGPLSKEVFVVHGHDDAARLDVCALLTKAGFTPVVLHEQANRGQTVIEKLERHSDVGFAVVLLTPDDKGGPADGDMHPRARQNVIAELFYFIGKLGRARVCALKKGELEIPSDIGGVVYVTLDDHGGWKNTLLRELEGAGYEFDWGKALR
jgi:predicted nucleotide-binding protein